MSIQVLQEMCLKSQNPGWKEGVDRRVPDRDPDPDPVLQHLSDLGQGCKRPELRLSL